MHIRLIGLLYLFVAAGFLPVTGYSHSSTDASTVPAGSVPETVERITKKLERQGYTIPLVVDHAAAAASVGLELPPTQVIFARPPRIVEKALLARSTTSAIDLPLKFLVFERDGEVHVNINPIGYLVDRHDVPFRDLLLRVLDYTIEQFGRAPTGLVTIESLVDVEETVQNLLTVIGSNPAFRIPLVLDYGAERHHDHHYPRQRAPVLIVFGNPNAGTPLMQADQEIGIDLPQKMLIWENRQGNVNITYNDPFFIAARHNIQDQDALLEVIAGALQRFALIGAGKDPDL